jgi:quercetin dioxygenase-like cupin family protein
MSIREIIKTENVSVRVMELEAGAANEWHHHSQVTDYFVGMTGVIQVETRDPAESVRLLPGQLAEVGPSTVHRVNNVGAEKAEYLLVQGVGLYDFCRENAVRLGDNVP